MAPTRADRSYQRVFAGEHPKRLCRIGSSTPS